MAPSPACAAGVVGADARDFVPLSPFVRAFRLRALRMTQCFLPSPRPGLWPAFSPAISPPGAKHERLYARTRCPS